MKLGSGENVRSPLDAELQLKLARHRGVELLIGLFLAGSYFLALAILTLAVAVSSYS
jgi:hypothetical protein